MKVSIVAGSRWLWPSWLICLFLLMACADEPLPSPRPVTPTVPAGNLQIGLTSSASAVKDLIDAPYLAYAQSANLAPVAYTTANNSTLLSDLAGDLLDGALVYAIPEDSDLWFSPVAMDGLVVVVHPDNAVTSLTQAEIQAVFSGRINNWASLGGRDEPITVLSREPGSGTRLIFDQRLMAEQRVSINAQVVTGNEALLAAVANDRSAIGYSMMGSAADVELLAIDDELPSPDTTSSQSYPLTAPLYFVSPAEPQGAPRAFLAWLQSPTGQTLLGAKYGRVR